MEPEVLDLVVLENDVSESTTKEAPVLSFEEWDANRLNECTDLLLT